MSQSSYFAAKLYEACVFRFFLRDILTKLGGKSLGKSVKKSNESWKLTKFTKIKLIVTSKASKQLKSSFVNVGLSFSAVDAQRTITQSNKAVKHAHRTRNRKFVLHHSSAYKWKQIDGIQLDDKLSFGFSFHNLKSCCATIRKATVKRLVI